MTPKGKRGIPPQTYWERQTERKQIRGFRESDTLISYQKLGNGPRTMMLACGLGGRLYIWEPILERFSGSWTFITWDYRGLFVVL